MLRVTSLSQSRFHACFAFFPQFSRKRETVRSLGFFFFPADAVTVFGADTTGLGPFSEQVRQTGLTTFYWRFISSLTGASGSVLHVTKLSYLAARPSLAPRPLHVLFFFFCLTDRPHFTRGGRWETKHFTGMALCICLLV